MSPQIISLDNFYANPGFIRSRALSCDYWDCSSHPTGGNWPGIRSEYISAIFPEVFQEFCKNIYSIFNWDSDKSVYFETNFQACKASDGNSWVHQDVMVQNHTHVGIVYLHPNPKPNSGTIIYEPKSGLDFNDPNLNTGDPDNFNISYVAENKYNKCIIYSPDHWHKSDIYFGDNLFDSRMTQVFFFREEGATEKFSQPLK